MGAQARNGSPVAVRAVDARPTSAQAPSKTTFNQIIHPLLCSTSVEINPRLLAVLGCAVLGW
jgi:hypothetical protein